MRLVLISDTHGRFEPDLPGGDVLIHAGDLSMEGTPMEVYNAFRWLGQVRDRYENVIVIAGNHDFFAEEFPQTMQGLAEDFGLVYLHNSTFCMDYGLRVWGSPVTPEFMGWAFMSKRGPEIGLTWSQIPDDIDILVTHGPPHGILDRAYNQSLGCERLREEVVQRVKPKLHVFGHIHEGRGQTEIPGLRTRFVNASMLNEHYTPAGDPFVIDLED